MVLADSLKLLVRNSYFLLVSLSRYVINLNLIGHFLEICGPVNFIVSSFITYCLALTVCDLITSYLAFFLSRVTKIIPLPVNKLNHS